jgi:hypothetical protein
VNTTSELTYHWVGFSQILSENAVERSRQTCLYENHNTERLMLSARRHFPELPPDGRQRNQRGEFKL